MLQTKDNYIAKTGGQKLKEIFRFMWCEQQRALFVY